MELVRRGGQTDIHLLFLKYWRKILAEEPPTSLSNLQPKLRAQLPLQPDFLVIAPS